MNKSADFALAAYPQAQGAARQPAYSEDASSYDRRTAAFQAYRQTVVEALPVDPGQVVLDVGCGTGLCCGMLVEKVGAQGGVVGIEESPEMAAIARERVAREGWGNVKLRPEAQVAAGGGKWASPWLVGVNIQARMLHAPFVRSFDGFDRPWHHLEPLIEDVELRELAFGSGYVLTGRVKPTCSARRPGPAPPTSTPRAGSARTDPAR
jgi:SAM-dependent methyltransferase